MHHFKDISHKLSHQIGAHNHVVLEDGGAARKNELEYLIHTLKESFLSSRNTYFGLLCDQKITFYYV